jgi:hypothetical protein
MYPSINANRFTSVKPYPIILVLSLVFGATISAIFFRGNRVEEGSLSRHGQIIDGTRGALMWSAWGQVDSKAPFCNENHSTQRCKG